MSYWSRTLDIVLDGGRFNAAPGVLRQTVYTLLHTCNTGLLQMKYLKIRLILSILEVHFSELDVLTHYDYQCKGLFVTSTVKWTII